MTVAGGISTVFARGLFDGRVARGPSLLRIAEGRIAAVEPVPAEGEVVADMTVAYALPGLIDAHVHVNGYREGIPAGNPYGPAKHFLRLCLAQGVTTVRDVGNSIESLYYLREWGERYGAPRIYGSGPLLDGAPFTWPFTRHVVDEIAAKWHVNQLADAGVDLVKTYTRLSPPLVRAVVDAARARGLPVAAHCGATTARDAALAGVRSLEHAEELLHPYDDLPDPPRDAVDRIMSWAKVDPDGAAVTDLAGVLLAAGTALCPTLLVSRRWCLLDEMVGEPNNDRMVPVMPYHAHFPQLRGVIGMRIGAKHMARYMPVRVLARGERDRVEAGLAALGAVVRRLHNAGIPVIAGTDSPNPSIVPGHALHQELLMLHRTGLGATDVLVAATSGAADVIGAADVGVVERGAHADLLLLRADPTADLGALRSVAGVVKGGRLVDLDDVERRIAEQMAAAQR
ncbi:MAG TPA: amidohydrolase family protein [Frankiaceae bacterium]|nr:amidohydrolase family protein [Frankiaceae bacterium]